MHSDALAIHECTKLFFLQLNGPIHLYTDASDFGIGAYLSQLIEGQECQNRNETTLLVKWLGFEEPTPEPYSNRSLFKTAAMHKYLRANKLVALIPAAYKN